MNNNNFPKRIFAEYFINEKLVEEASKVIS